MTKKIKAICKQVVITGQSTTEINIDDNPIEFHTTHEPGSKLATITITENGTYRPASDLYIGYREVTVDVAGIDTSDATASASDILYGKTAYVDGIKITGSIPSVSVPSTITENQTLNTAGKYLEDDIIINVPQLDTSDATATSADILLNETAYVNGVKVTGSIQSMSGSTVTENSTIACANKYMTSDIIVNVPDPSQIMINTPY